MFQYNVKYSSYTNEIRVIGVYTAGSIFENPQPTIINLNIKTCANSVISKPLILLLSSYDTINWIISSDDQTVIDNLVINTIEVVAYKFENTTITVSSNLSVTGNVTVTPTNMSPFKYGYGEDSGGGDTAQQLYTVPQVFGDYAYSFLGAYNTDYMDVCVGDQGIATYPYAGTVYEASPTPTKNPITFEPTTDITTATATTEQTPDEECNPGLYTCSSYIGVVPMDDINL